jgi:N-acetylglutamate synthase-like GNAT family acetyltransferase
MSSRLPTNDDLLTYKVTTKTLPKELESLHFRFSTEKDAEQMSAIINTAYEVENFFKACNRTSPKQLIATMKEGLEKFLVLSTNDDLVIGCVCIAPTNNTSIYFGMLSVNPKYQGFGLGIGMIHTVEKIAKDYGYEYTELWVVNLRNDLIPWYTKQGYKEVGSGPWPEHLKNELKQPAHFIKMHKYT